MSFILRNAHLSDLKYLCDLAAQFSLLNLPPDRKIMGEKIERSIASFAGDLPKTEAEYLFVLEDQDNGVVAGSSLILAKHGSEDVPHYAFRVEKREHYSDDLGTGFIHQVLQLREDTDGPTEIGGLLIDRNYRGHPEKLGKQISLIRFIYMGMFREDFEPRVLCELTPPLGEGGRSEFWEALGRHFTGLPYQEADRISQKNKEFIHSLFPQHEIYLTPLNPRARMVVGRVGEETMPAQHLLESIGFRYVNEVDPFDGGPHFGARLDDIKTITDGRWLKVDTQGKAQVGGRGLIGVKRDGEFRGIAAAYAVSGDELVLPAVAARSIELEAGEKVFFSQI